MVIAGEPSLAAATPGDDAAATAAVRFAGFQRERAKAGCATRGAERNKRRALHQAPMVTTPAAAPIPAVMPTLAIMGGTPNPAAPSTSSISAAAVAAAPITPSPISTPLFAFAAASKPTMGPISSTASSTRLTAIMLSPVSTPSCQVTSLCVGGVPMTTVRATTLKKERSRGAAATRVAERKKRRVMKQASVVRNQAAKLSPAATSAPSFVDAELSWAGVMSHHNATSLHVGPTLIDMDQPSTADVPSEGVTLELSLSIFG
uniref:Uncharacterized protein n=1 Tax=Oryza brachyantha TaxID=4533 RepID=J3ND12_ORYBR